MKTKYEFELEKQMKEESKAWKELGVKTKDRFDYAYACGKSEGLRLGYKLAMENKKIVDGRTREGKQFKPKEQEK